MAFPKDCHHGKGFDEECLEREVEWWKDSVEAWTKLLSQSKAKLAKAKLKLKEQKHGKPTPEN